MTYRRPIRTTAISAISRGLLTACRADLDNLASDHIAKRVVTINHAQQLEPG